MMINRRGAKVCMSQVDGFGRDKTKIASQSNSAKFVRRA